MRLLIWTWVCEMRVLDAKAWVEVYIEGSDTDYVSFWTQLGPSERIRRPYS